MMQNQRFFHRFARLIPIALLLVLSVVMTTPARALPPTQTDQTPQIDLVLLIDESGSAWGRTDPEPTPNRRATPQRGELPAPPKRIETAQYILSRLSVEPAQARHTVSVFFFGSTVATPSNPIIDRPLNIDTVDTINQDIQRAHIEVANLDFTDVEAAFRRAYEALKNKPVDPARRSVILMITDGKPETELANSLDGNNTPEARRIPAYLAETQATIRTLDGVPNARGCSANESAQPAYALVVNVETMGAYAGTPYVDPEIESWWGQPSVLGGNYYEVPSFERLWREASIVVSRLLCVAGREPVGPYPVPYTFTADVTDDFTSITFDIKGSTPDTKATLLSPDGTPLPEGSDPDAGISLTRTGSSYVWGIDRDKFTGDWAGTWSVRVEGTGLVEFSFASVSRDLLVEMSGPYGGQHPAGKPLELRGRVVDGERNPITDPIATFVPTVTLKLTDGITETVAVTTDGTGSERSIRIDRPARGQYTIEMQADLENGRRALLTPSGSIAVVPLPWVRVLAPRTSAALYADDDVDVIAQVVRQGANDSSPRALDEISAGRSIVTARLVREGQSSADSVTLQIGSQDGQPRHLGTLPGPGEEGDYLLEVTLEQPTGQGDPWRDIITQTVRFLPGSAPVAQIPTDPPTATAAPTESVPTATVAVVPTATVAVLPTPTPVAPAQDNGLLIPGLIALAGLGGVAAFFAFRPRGPRLDGTWLDTGDGNINLSGRRHRLHLRDSMGMSQGLAEITRVEGGSGPVGHIKVRSINEGQNLTINGLDYSAGQETDLEDGSVLEIGGRTMTYGQGPNV